MPTTSSNVRVRGHSGKHMLELSSSQYDPNRSFGSGTKSVIKGCPKRRDDRRAALIALSGNFWCSSAQLGPLASAICAPPPNEATARPPWAPLYSASAPSQPLPPPRPPPPF